MQDDQKCRADFVRFWEAEILPELAEQFFLIEKSDEIKNLCFLTWLESSKQSDGKQDGKPMAKQTVKPL